MVMLIDAEVEPAELFAQTVYVAAVICKTEGVPLMAPVLELNNKPLGTAGVISQLVTAPPPTLGVLVLMATPLVKVMFSGEYARLFGAGGVTQRLNSPVLEMPVDAVAVRLYVVLEPATVGVPLMVHVP